MKILIFVVWVALGFKFARRRTYEFLSEDMGRLFVDPAMVEEVEVLRGAGSSLYGSDACGVVNIKTRDHGDVKIMKSLV